MAGGYFFFSKTTLWVNSGRIATIVYKKTDEWYIEWQRVTTTDDGWQRMTTSGTTNDSRWQQVVQRVTMSGTTSDNEWRRVKMNDNEEQKMTMSDR